MPTSVIDAMSAATVESLAKRTLSGVVTPGLVPGVHVFFGRKEHVDARDKPGHDDKGVIA
jgi:hypothetical protein